MVAGTTENPHAPARKFLAAGIKTNSIRSGNVRDALPRCERRGIGEA